MQGQLSELDIRSILQLAEFGQRTGELYVEAYGASPASRLSLRENGQRGDAPSWLVFLVNGQIVYAGRTDGHLERLRDHLRRRNLEQALDALDETESSAIATLNSPEYGYLWALLERQVLTPEEGRGILTHMVYETLFDLLSLRHGSFVFKLSPALNPQLTPFAIDPIVTDIAKQVQTWKQLHLHIQSPEQCPVILDESNFRAIASETTYNRLSRWLDGKTSLRRLARHLNRSLLTVAKGLYPYAERGLVGFSSTGPEASMLSAAETGWHSSWVPRIVCVDDGAAVRQTIEQILDSQGYEATSIGNPLKALGLLFQLQPDLILCDIAMPELEGYELCAMLRSSSAFRQTPIIMLTGMDGFLDRVKARMAGATDYLTKPFGPHELLTLVEKYVGAGNPQRLRPEKLLADAIEDELDLDMLPSSPG